MQRVYTGESDKEGYKNMVKYDDGSRVYYNEFGSVEELSRIFSAAWDSLPPEKQIAINKKIEERKKSNARNRNEYIRR
ncbi:MAG: hypothetical protein RSB80_07880 [Anaerovoracaceae bacterium]